VPVAIPLRIEFAPAGSWESDTGEAYIHGEQGVVCLFDKVGYGVLQFDTGDSLRSVRVNFPTHQGSDGWLYGPPTLESGLYDFDELQVLVGGIRPVETEDGGQRPGSITDMEEGVKLHCRFGLSLYDPDRGARIAWISHYDEDEWHWEEPEPDIYMIRESETQWRLVNNGYVNHWFEPEPADHPVYMPFEVIITALRS